MTAVIDDEVTEATDETTEGESSEPKKRGRKPGERNLAKPSKLHQELAEFINGNAEAQKAGVTVTAEQVGAVLLLRTDFSDTPERKAAREAAKAEREAEKEKYAGLTQEEIKAEKAAVRAEKQALKLQERVQAALDKAKAIREGKDASGEDVAAAVEAAQGGTPADAKRSIGRKR